ncbi:glycosyltransferase [Candidatus Fonsibacter ubiquis]|uniref:glycosyltransferase n=1 Tax=Candidatus Fonsibacter ubiquis TaxID=1925548 RepID=UPI000C069464|nr:glycosyltransferase [Candidatus Fonsibacter ubiquis]
MKSLAPIVIFSYKRRETIEKLIISLLKNKESKNSNLYIFQDNHKNIYDKNRVEDVKSYIRNINGFKKKKIYYRSINFGLSKNIIEGIKLVFSKYNKAIFLEDDLIVSDQFLKFMNKCLNFYYKKKKIWHISGWNYDINIKNNKYDAFIIRNTNSWGWATWKDRWKYFSKDPEKIVKTWKSNNIAKFNLDNVYDFFLQIKKNYLRISDTWGIFWYATVFVNRGLCIYPKKSLVKNIGFDEFATNTKVKQFFFDNTIDYKKKNIMLPIKLKENKLFLEAIKNLILKQRSLLYKIYMIIKKYQKNIIKYFCY